MIMNMQSKEMAANMDDDLKVFVRSSPRELKSGELDLVAGGEKPRRVPNG
jgi:hypothetical protein